MIYICLTEDLLFLKLNGLDDLLQRVKNMWQRKVINRVKKRRYKKYTRDCLF